MDKCSIGRIKKLFKSCMLRTHCNSCYNPVCFLFADECLTIQMELSRATMLSFLHLIQYTLQKRHGNHLLSEDHKYPKGQQRIPLTQSRSMGCISAGLLHREAVSYIHFTVMFCSV